MLGSETFTLAPRRRLQPEACAASATAVGSISMRVFRGVRVASRAMRLPRVLSREPFATENVLAIGHRLEVVRINARSVAAQMIERHPVWDRPDEPLVDHAVRNKRLRSAEALYGTVSVPISRLPDEDHAAIWAGDRPTHYTLERVGSTPGHTSILRRC